jgi:acyl dehydratase
MLTLTGLDQVREYAGRELGVSDWRLVTQEEIDEFARVTGDDQWIHVDVERAMRESPFGSTVAHGYLTLSLLAPTAMEVFAGRVAARQALNYGLDKVRFLAPVRAGRRVRNRIALRAVEAKGDGRFLVTTENTIEIEGESKPALVATALAMLME